MAASGHMGGSKLLIKQRLTYIRHDALAQAATHLHCRAATPLNISTLFSLSTRKINTIKAVFQNQAAASTRPQINPPVSENPEVKLLGSWTTPYVMRARIALNLKEVQYEFLEEQFGTKSELLLKLNPIYKKIPVLIHDGKPICESMIIVQYINDVWTGSGTSLMPADAYDRAMHRFWTVYIDDKFVSSLFGMMRGPTEEGKAQAREQTLAALPLLEDAFAKISKGKPFFGGDTIGYLDIALGSFLGWMRAFEEISGTKLFDDAKTPLLCAWAEKFCNDEAVRVVFPEHVKLVEFAKVLLERYENGLPPAT